MKTKTYSSLGLNVTLSVPESVEEFDQNAKRSGACLDEATNNVVYRGSLAEFRDSFCEKLSEQSGVSRLTKSSGKKDADGNDILVYAESEAEYAKRVAAEKNVEVSTFQPLADEVAASITFDAAARERKAPAPKKLPDWAKKVAEEFLAGTKSLPKFAAAYEKLVGQRLVVADGSQEDKVKALATACVAFKSAQDPFGKM